VTSAQVVGSFGVPLDIAFIGLMRALRGTVWSRLFPSGHNVYQVEVSFQAVQRKTWQRQKATRVADIAPQGPKEHIATMAMVSAATRVASTMLGLSLSTAPKSTAGLTSRMTN
jgi:hypothetical protein